LRDGARALTGETTDIRYERPTFPPSQEQLSLIFPFSDHLF